jgi:hypothetical protein
MSTTMHDDDASVPDRSRTYVLVLVVHALAVTALWAFGHYFGAL